MNDRVQAHQINSADLIRARTRFEAAAVGLRLAASLRERFGSAESARAATAAADPQSLQAGLDFVHDYADGFGFSDENRADWQGEIDQLRAGDVQHPISRLAAGSDEATMQTLIADLLVLAILPELHEGFAALFRQLHPLGWPYPTAALALHWLEFEQSRSPVASWTETRPQADDGETQADAPGSSQEADAFLLRCQLRDQVEALLLHSNLARLGILRLDGDAPWHSRTLVPGPGVADALLGRKPNLSDMQLTAGFKAVPGLQSWLTQADAAQAVQALQRGEPCLIAVLGGNATMRSTRMRALLGAAGRAAIQTRVETGAAPELIARAALDAYGVAFLHQAYPWLELSGESQPGAVKRASLDFDWQMPLLISAEADQNLPDFRLPLLVLRCDALPAPARREMWSSLLPQLDAQAGVLASRYPLDPDEARHIAADLALRQRLEQRPLTLDDIGDCLRSRTLWQRRPGVNRVIPKAGWRQLLLPSPSVEQLRQAVLRVHQQITVLDDWGFEQGRHDRRGVRMLFYGPPGTGKTLAAEAMAKALGIDLLVVDIASLVSKWIGETEKNLAAVFEVAETSRALLLFDEADALFGRRTESRDAHDRYANLETAFLLQRLERYEGVAALTTNLRSSLDPAFTRRFEFIVEFPEPDADTRERLWRLHIPDGAPLAGDVDLRQLADWYAISGAQIRNAALGAAFLAASDGNQIRQQHFLRAIQREYDKAGKAHPGHPPARENACARTASDFQPASDSAATGEVGTAYG